jgi:hypothetical protein
MYSQEYVQHLSKGPFPEQIDPWAEAARYFHQIHGCMISELLERLRLPLLALGYVAARETKTISDLEAVFISQLRTHELVTVIEVISPSQKTLWAYMEHYQQRREKFVKDKEINFVEFDFTRSVNRLVRDHTTTAYAYQITVNFLSDVRIIGIEFGQPLKSFALPLHNEIIVIDTQDVYRAAYQQASIAPQLEGGGYSESNLPFPSLLTAHQRQQALKMVEEWQNTLMRFQTEENGKE